MIKVILWDIDALVREALENIERVRIEPGEDV